MERECEAHDYSKTDRRTDGQTDRRTNGQTDWESVKKVEINVREKQRREKKTIMCVCVRERVRQTDRRTDGQTDRRATSFVFLCFIDN